MCPSMCVCLCMLLPSMPKGVLLCKGFPSTDMLYLTPRHNGDWSPPVQSGTAADRSHSCLPAFSTACVHQAPTSHCNADCWIRNKRPGMEWDLHNLTPVKHYENSTKLLVMLLFLLHTHHTLNKRPICSGFHTVPVFGEIYTSGVSLLNVKPDHILLLLHKALKGKPHLSYTLHCRCNGPVVSTGCATVL